MLGVRRKHEYEPPRWRSRTTSGGVLLGCVVGVVLLASTPVRPDERAEAAACLDVSVDASAIWSGLLRSEVTVPARPGALRLHYPKWVPGRHARSSAIKQVSRLVFRCGREPIPWRRDAKDPWSFLCTVPDGSDSVTVEIQFAVDLDQDHWSWGESAACGSLAKICWQNLLLYPAGWNPRQERVRGHLRVPDGWKTATSLIAAETDRENGSVAFRVVTLEELVDSPVVLGRFLHTFGLPNSNRQVPHRLTVCGDSEEDTDVPVHIWKALGRAIDETETLLGPPPMDRYHFLLLVTDGIAGGGREHLRSTVVVARPSAFDGPDSTWTLETLVHEYVHAWNGKRHRPAGMCVADFQTRPDFRLLWVYEGLTTYLSYVIARRSGLWTDDDLHWTLAYTAERARQGQAAGAWRSLEDVCAAAPLATGEVVPWERRRRDLAHYGEAALLWLGVDATLRRQTDGEASLDTFCGRLFGRAGDPDQVVTYDWNDLVAHLAGLSDDDWAAYLEARVRRAGSVDAAAALDACGWSLAHRQGAFEPQPARWTDYRRHGPFYADLTSSIGVLVGLDQVILEVVPGSAAERAGLAPGIRIVKVNGGEYRLGRLIDAVGLTPRTPLMLEVAHGGETRTVRVEYDLGHRLPFLERIDDQPDLLARIMTPRTRE